MSLYSLLPLFVESKRFKPIIKWLPLDVCSPSFEGTKGSRYGILARKILETQANTYSIITTSSKHGNEEFKTHIKAFINSK